MSHYHRENMGKEKSTVTRTSKMLRRAFIVSLGITFVAPLAGCGRKSVPDKPKDSKYPREYPSQ